MVASLMWRFFFGSSDLEGVSAATCTTALTLPAAASSVVAASAATAANEEPTHATEQGEQPSKSAEPASTSCCDPSKTPETHFGPEAQDEGSALYPPDLHNTATLLISDRKNGPIRKKVYTIYTYMYKYIYSHEMGCCSCGINNI